MHTVYVLRSKKDDKWYIGCTANLAKRLREHNGGRVRSTKSRRPFTVVYQERYESVYEAFAAERFYKTPVGKRKLKEKINNCGIV